MILYTLIGRKFRAEGLERCSYSTGGGMLGGHRSVELKKDKDGGRTVTCRERDPRGPGEDDGLPGGRGGFCAGARADAPVRSLRGEQA